MRPYRLAILLLSLSLAACSNAAPSATAVKLAESPTVDGRLTEACWQPPAPMTGFSILDRGTPAVSQTQAWVATDDDAVYFAVKALDATPEKVKGTAAPRDANIFSDDVIEIIIDAARDRFTFLHFAFNAAGAQYDEAGDAVGATADWSVPWTVKTAKGPDGWTAEARLPFAGLRLSPDVSDTWGVNLCRNRAADGELSSWSPTGGSFATPQNFGTLTLAADTKPFMLQAAVTSWGRGAIGQNEVTCRLTNLTGKDCTAKPALEVTPPKEAPRTTEAAAITIPAGATVESKLVYQLFEQGKHVLQLTATDPAGRLLRAEGLTMDVTALADFMVFKSFYRDDAAVRYDIHASADMAAQSKIRAELRKDGSDEVLARQEVTPDASGSGRIRFDTAGLAMGDYTIAVAMVGADGQPLVQDDLRFAQLRDPAVTDRLVTVRDDNMLIVEGKPFFPIGIYQGPATEAGLQAFADAGFNLLNIGQMTPQAAKPVLDRLQQYNIRAWIPLSHLLDTSQDTDKRKERLADYAARLGNHPALLCWESIDEPAWGSQNAEGLFDGYRYLRALDQQRPIWTNHAPRNLVSTLAYFNRATDVAGADIYPVPEPQRQSNIQNPAISVVRDETLKNVEAVAGEKPIFMVLQGFGWKELSQNTADHDSAVMPTFEQSRFMAYDSIVNGANGVLYWGTHYTKKPSRFFSELKSLVSELAVMQDVLSERTFTGPGHATLASENASVKLMHKQHSGRDYILLVNETPQDVTAEVSAPAVNDGNLRRLFEAQTVVIADGRFSLTLAGYGVALLSDDTEIADVRKDFSSEWQNAAAQAPKQDLREPGNLLANPGMEIDADGDGLPDGWPSQTPFVAIRTDEQAHGGKYSVKISSEDSEFAPLCIQNGLDVKVNQPYELSAWLKTSEPGVTYRIYLEWSVGGKWYSGILPWTAGTGEWEQAKVRFTPQVASGGSAYAVLQLKGKGSVYYDDVALREAQ